MASFTGVGDNTTLSVVDRDEKIEVDISGTYDMTILFQRAVGDGAWETLKTYNTADATVADVYYTVGERETLRLIVTVDTSGTATATLTDTARKVREDKDRVGNVLFKNYQGGGTTGWVVPRPPVALDVATTLTEEEHANRPLTHSAAAGYDITLPAATGTGNTYTVYVITTVATTDLVVQVANATDEIRGMAASIDATNFLAADGDDTITLNGTTTGGISGTIVRITDVASGLFFAEVWQGSSGTEATPFSAAVS